MPAAARPATFIQWRKSPESIAREKAREAAEQAEVVVRVVLSLDGSNEASIYRKGRLGLKYQDLSADEIAQMGNDDAAFFRARWSTSEVKWVLLGRTEECF